MALISCGECGREVSDKATACPQCGAPAAYFAAPPPPAPPEPAPRPAVVPAPAADGQKSIDTWPYIVVGVTLVVLMVLGIRMLGTRATAPAPAAPYASTAMPAQTWRVTGRQGQGVVFIVMDSAQATDKLAFQRAAATECPPTWCQAMFWLEGSPAPAALPLTDDQARTQVALYSRNASTGLSRFTWQCEAFPGTPDSECYSLE